MLKDRGLENWDLVLNECDAWGCPSVVRQKRQIEELIMTGAHCALRRKRQAEKISLRPWQTKLIAYLDVKQPRAFHWFWEDKGNVGKSFLVRYLMERKDYILVKRGSNADMAENIVNQHNSRTMAKGCFVLDLTRSCDPNDKSSFGQVPDLIEDLKNGYIVRKKYTGGVHSFDMPTTVVVFANCPPPDGVWSEDRYGSTWNMRTCSFINKFGKVDAEFDEAGESTNKLAKVASIK